MHVLTDSLILRISLIIERCFVFCLKGIVIVFRKMRLVSYQVSNLLSFVYSFIFWVKFEAIYHGAGALNITQTTVCWGVVETWKVCMFWEGRVGLAVDLRNFYILMVPWYFNIYLLD